ncbi:MAG: aminotransferase class V-fold PLP-dependent enzyme [Spirochaetia bacterium]|nr:aminotransferase class V-fold PLP-dependent enzyme [Spirochaetia bacterium]
MSLEHYFSSFRNNIAGIHKKIFLPDIQEEKPLLYADWIASGRLYGPIETYMLETVGPYVANTHTETTLTGTTMTQAYHAARETIKSHVHADNEDCLFLAGYGMTSAVNKLQRILGLRIPESMKNLVSEEEKPVVLITHMEHHSNQITWEECNVEIRIIPPDSETGLPDLQELEKMAKKFSSRPLLIGAFSAGSNVTGILTPYHEMAKIIHRYGGKCFVDFAASAPYVNINMHPPEPGAHLDAVMFSPHKFLGGPGSSGVLIMSRELYHNTVPDSPGGGTVQWTNPFGSHLYIDDIEIREDGGTPGFLQAIRTALTIKVKEAMGVDNIQAREEELMKILFDELEGENDIFILEKHNKNRLGILSFFTKGVHHNLIVRLLNDRFGIQTRGGCSCAGTYGHILFHINKISSSKIQSMITGGDLTEKPGWVRLSIHPTMTDDEVRYIGRAVKEILLHADEWRKQYAFDKNSGDFNRVSGFGPEIPDIIGSFPV